MKLQELQAPQLKARLNNEVNIPVVPPPVDKK